MDEACTWFATVFVLVVFVKVSQQKTVTEWSLLDPSNILAPQCMQITVYTHSWLTDTHNPHNPLQFSTNYLFNQDYPAVSKNKQYWSAETGQVAQEL